MTIHPWALFVAVALAAGCATTTTERFGGDGGPDAITDASAVDAPAPDAWTIRDDFSQPVLDTGAPANAPQLFAGADQVGSGPCLYEPELGTLFPNNWLRPRFRFVSTQNENLFEIELVVPNEATPLRVYTPQSGYVMASAIWSILRTVGIGTIHVRVRSAVVNGNQLVSGPWKGSEGDVEIAPIDASGSVVYWTTSNGTVLKGFKIGDETVQQVLTPPQAGVVCVGCHSSTPDGLFVGFTGSNNPAGGPSWGLLRSVDGNVTTPPFLTADAIALLSRTDQDVPSFSAGHWSKGDRVALTMMTPAGQAAEIVWTDLEASSQTQGAGWGVLARNGDNSVPASATFSHDGNTVAYVATSKNEGGMNTSDGRIFTVPFNGRQGGTATPLAGASDAAFVQYYPSFSADDRYVAFARVPLGTPNSYSAWTTVNNSQAEAFIVPAAGGNPTRLAANDPPACLGVTSPGVTNSWPKWSPQVKTANGKSYYFLVFSSTRDPKAQGPQLYVAPIVVDGAGNVTTYSALYLWNQPESEHNHTPAWDVFQLPPPPN